MRARTCQGLSTGAVTKSLYSGNWQASQFGHELTLANGCFAVAARGSRSRRQGRLALLYPAAAYGVTPGLVASETGTASSSLRDLTIASVVARNFWKCGVCTCAWYAAGSR